jgi:AraC family transcriptional regulator
MAYVMRARIERAKQMLRGDCGMITQVALELGFCDHSHFTRSFRRVTGHTPRDFIRSSLS